jgi:hypothetical protein
LVMFHKHEALWPLKPINYILCVLWFYAIPCT